MVRIASVADYASRYARPRYSFFRMRLISLYFTGDLHPVIAKKCFSILILSISLSISLLYQWRISTFFMTGEQSNFRRIPRDTWPRQLYRKDFKY